MSDQRSDQRSNPGEKPKGKVDGVTILYILGGIPAIVAYVVILFTLVHYFPSIPA